MGVDTLKGDGPFTLFAPTNAAFDKIDSAILADIQADPAKLEMVLTYHVVSGNVMSSDLTEGMVTTVAGPSVTVSLNPVMINNSTVTTADIMAKNGVIHIIDTVLLPEEPEDGGDMGGGGDMGDGGDMDDHDHEGEDHEGEDHEGEDNEG